MKYTDTSIRRHLYPQTAARRPPFVMGYDLVGKIDQIGDGVSGFQVGDSRGRYDSGRVERPLSHAPGARAGPRPAPKGKRSV
jgi:NADPH:quinone reductase-like Zn-dependent oxidoreductase